MDKTSANIDMDAEAQVKAPAVLAVVGPTASGKTVLSLALARELGGEIICCDSMQIYRGMDIGTAKPTAEEMGGIVHHLLDIVDPCESFSVADYVPLAVAAIEDIRSRGKLPIFCGGTGLYLDAVLSANVYSKAGSDPALRASLSAKAAEEGAEALWKRLSLLDPESAAAIHPNNVKRVIRALEICLLTGVPKSEWDKRSRLAPSPYHSLVLGLSYPERSQLYARIDRRVDLMMSQGLEAEVRALCEKGMLPEGSTAAQAIGYKEMLGYLRGEGSLSEAVEAIKLATRRYAKRQITWFGSKPYVENIEVFGSLTNESVKKIVKNAKKAFQFS